MPDLNDDLDILGSLLPSRLYTQLCLCFSVVDPSSHSAIINTLTKGLEQLSANFPWVAGQVVNEGASEGNPGVPKIKSFEKTPILVVKDLRQESSIPTMDTLRKANFPLSMLDESIIAPRNTLPGIGDPDSAPVFLLQANFITGGLLLTFIGAHNIMDMVGQGQLMRLFSKACHNEAFTSEELSSGNLARRNLIPFLDDSYQPGPELARQIVTAPPSLPPSDAPPPKCSWSYFSFPSTSLDALKSLATKTITLPSGYISTDDALSAFIWQSVSRARLPRLDHTREVSTSRAVDIRRYLGIPPTYPGMTQNLVYHTYTLQKLVMEPLGSIASQLRLAVDPKTSSLGYDTRALGTVIHRGQNNNNVSLTASLDLSADIMISSWAGVSCYELDFNLGLGKPESVRRPQFVPVESLFYFMPKALDGEIAVGLCLRDEDLERLRADEEFGKYGRYIG